MKMSKIYTVFFSPLGLQRNIFHLQIKTLSFWYYDNL